MHESTVGIEAAAHGPNFKCVGQVTSLDDIAIVLFAVQVEKNVPLHGLFQQPLLHLLVDGAVPLLDVADHPAPVPPLVQRDLLPPQVQIPHGLGALVARLTPDDKALVPLVLLQHDNGFLSATALNLQTLYVFPHLF